MSCSARRWNSFDGSATQTWQHRMLPHKSRWRRKYKTHEQKTECEKKSPCIWHCKRRSDIQDTRKVTQASVTLSFTSIDGCNTHAKSCPTQPPPPAAAAAKGELAIQNVKRMKNNTTGAHLSTSLSASLLPHYGYCAKCEQICWIPFHVHARRAHFLSMRRTLDGPNERTSEQHKKWRIFVCTTSNLCDVMHLSLCWSAPRNKRRKRKMMRNTHSKMLWRRHRVRLPLLLLLLLSPTHHSAAHLSLTSDRNGKSKDSLLCT